MKKLLFSSPQGKVIDFTTKIESMAEIMYSLLILLMKILASFIVALGQLFTFYARRGFSGFVYFGG